jgi:geranylgeranyl pyrophosphate synthase
MLKDELKKNAELITKVIQNDDFPESVSPTCLRDAVKDYPLRGGKRLRSALLLWSCGLLGGDVESAKFAAAAVEIYHNWTLVHDDIIDDDDIRRHQPSSHVKLANFAETEYDTKGLQCVKFGRDFAMLAGDVQQGWAVNMLTKSVEAGVSEETTLLLISELQYNVNRNLISGEALDVEFSYKPWDEIRPGEVENMLRLKTGVLLEFCARAGGIIALGAKFAKENRIKDIAKFAINIGIAFQLRDDWLGIFGEESEIGKPLASDLTETKPTTLFLDTLSSLSEYDQSRFEHFLGRISYSDNDICEIRELIRKSGAEERLLKRSEKLLKSAKKSLSSFPDNKYKKLLMELAAFMLERKK